MTSYLSFLIILPDNIKVFFFSKLNYCNILFNSGDEIFNPPNSVFTNQLSFNLLKYFAIPFLGFIILLLTFILIIHRYGFEKKLILKKELDIKTDNFLTELIFSDYSMEDIYEKIKRYKEDVLFKKKWYKVLILNKIISIKQNINGINPNLILIIYKSFGFHHYSKKLILNKRWENKLLGIYHYQILEYKIKTGYIRPYVNNHKNKFLNSNALIAMIILSDEKFELLANYQKKISQADEIKILDIIYNKKSPLPKKIEDWIDSKNSSIVRLAIKLMVRYREQLTTSQISSLLNNPDETVRKETLLAIRYLYIAEANYILINHYLKEENKRNKITSLKTFGVIGNQETIDFLSSFLLEEKDLEIKFEMVSSINAIDRTYFNNFKTDNEIENDIINRILLHVTNPYLN